jgi:EmrB/QacA subfamily drug resistance transporter
MDTTTAALTSPLSPAAAGLGTRLRWLCLVIVLAGEVMDLMDGTIVNIAAPAIRGDLGGGSSVLQWLSAAYTLSFAALLVTGGRLGDIFGRRRMFLLGVGSFTVMSLGCALAQTSDQLILLRVLQGMTAAVLIPQGFGVIRQVFPPDKVNQAFTAFGPVLGLSAVVAPIIGGLLVSADLFGWGWRAIFLVNVPVGIAAWIGAVVFLPRNDTRAGARLDYGGIVLSAAAATAMVFPLVQGREYGWPAWCWLAMAGGLGGFGVFAWYEKHRSGWHLVEPSLLRNGSFRSGLVVALSFFAAMTGLMLSLSLYLQLGLHFSAVKAGLAMAPLPFGIALSAPVAFGLVARLGRKQLHIGAIGLAVGLVILALTVDARGARTGPWSIAPGLLVGGLGMGFVFAPLFDVVLAGVSDEETGSASGLLNAVQQFAASIGVALLGTVFLDRFTSGHSASSALVAALVASLGLLVLMFATTFLLPRHAREGGLSH